MGIRMIILLVMSVAMGCSSSSHSARSSPVSLLRVDHNADASLALLIRPLTPLGVPITPLVNLYDQLQLSQGRKYAEGFPEFPNELLSSNYYDLAFTLYQIYYRTGDPYWRDKARFVARTWRDAPDNQSIAPCMNGQWSTCRDVPSPRQMSTLGLAVLTLEADDGQARSIVHWHARLVEAGWMAWWDPRENGYALMALVASTILGDDHRTTALQQLDLILSQQQADGSWIAPGTSDDCPRGYTHPPTFMTGILLEALVLYDRAIGDARILPAFKRTAS
jgi:hypothetical protein